MRVWISHRTSYFYHQPVALGLHRLMLRPREDREHRLLAFTLDITPDCRVAWATDVYGNAVATAAFEGETPVLVVESRAELKLVGAAGDVPQLDPFAQTYPFAYSGPDWTVADPFALPIYFDPQARLAAWVGAIVMGTAVPTLALLQDINAAVQRSARYEVRAQGGTQGPLDTLDRGIASCRDFAVLFAEAVRTLGFAARLVSGYLANPGGSAPGTASTHAWVEVFLPGAGWVAFDPTHGTMGGHNLVGVAAGRTMEETTPVSGTYAGRSDALRQMLVEVEVTA